MATKSKHSSPDEVYRDYLLKSIKNTIKTKSSVICSHYTPDKTVVRAKTAYLSLPEPEWTLKYRRRRDYDISGYFCDDSKPYKSVGEVHLNLKDLFLNGVTDQFKEQLEVMDQDSLLASKKKPLKYVVQVGKEPVVHTVQEPFRKDPSGRVISDNMHELGNMRNCVFADKCLESYLQAFQKKRQGEPPPSTFCGDMDIRLDESQHPVISNTSVGNIITDLHRSNREGLPEIEEESSEEEIEDDPMMKTFAVPEKNPGKRKLQKFRKKNQMEYRKTKLYYIRSLLCAIYNMKPRVLKSQNPLLWTKVQEYLNTDVILDNLGKPIARPCLDDTKSKTQSTRTLTFSPSTTGDMTKSNPSMPSLPKNVAGTWEGLMNAGEKQSKADAASKHNCAQTKKANNIEVNPKQWLHVGELERRLSIKRKMKKGQRSNPEDWLNQVKKAFNSSKNRLKTDLEDILEKKRNTQGIELHFKFDNVQIDNEKNRLREMRKMAYEHMTRLRKERQEPLKWFSNLESEMHNLIGRNDPEANEHLEKLRLFCHEKPQHISQGKDKLCLLVMSMPINTLLTQAVIDAVEFVLTQVLGGVTELLSIWINARKLQEVRKSIFIVAKNG